MLIGQAQWTISLSEKNIIFNNNLTEYLKKRKGKKTKQFKQS